MLRILGSAGPCGHSPNRRDVLRVGVLGGVANSAFAAATANAAGSGDAPANSFGAAKRVLLLYLQGAASQFETWDPRPDAPAEIRGQWSPAATCVPGTFICEKLPKLTQVVDQLAILRSMTHEFNNHSNLYTLSGYPAVDFSSETNPLDSRHHPFFGSVLDYLDQPESTPDGMPRNIGLPFRFSTYSPVFRRSGPYGAFLGHGYDPVWTEFDGTPTKSVPRVSFFSKLKDVDVKDPFLGISPDSRLRVAKDAQLRGGITLDRLDRRRSLLEQFDAECRRLDATRATKSIDRFQEMAYSLMTSTRLRNALDIGREPMNLREQYGMTLFGQSTLTARRLLEAGCPFVSVFWDEYKVVNTAWDTHFNHFSRLENELLPGFDSAVSSLLRDLQSRGLLDETLVLCLTEHGRTPRINRPDRGGGRDHWSRVYSVMMAGAGIRPGIVVGESDERGALVKDRPISPQDVLATVYHLNGIAPETTIQDRLNRPVRLTENGNIIRELLHVNGHGA